MRLRRESKTISHVVFTALAMVLLPAVLLASDVTITPASTSDSVVINDSSSTARLQVKGDGAVFLPGLATGSSGVTPLCYDSGSSPSGQVVTCPAGSSATPAFAYVYDRVNLSNAIIGGGADVPFSDNGPLSGVTHTAGTTSLTVSNAGTFKIDYRLNLLSAGAVSRIAIAVNGSVDASTIITALAPTGPVAGSAILSLVAGDVLTLRNDSAVPLLVDLSPGVSAQMVVTQVQ